ncbi:MAG: class II aldolase/adducin family protein [Victivallales bacterium]|nr:class II aldolase/adducin family protein [Victivallales bacterium]
MSIIKFRVAFISDNLPGDERIEKLSRWCLVFNREGLTPKLNGTGRSLGNLSFRYDPGKPVFIITGSTLDSKAELGYDDFVKVTETVPEKMLVYAAGKRDPSSESMMHYEIYKSRKDIGAVFHGHDREITAHAQVLGIPETSKEELPGTAGLMRQVMKVLGNNNFIVMKNHGFLSFGRTMDEAGNSALEMKKKLNTLRTVRK